jgi:hypothetical protein
VAHQNVGVRERREPDGIIDRHLGELYSAYGGPHGSAARTRAPGLERERRQQRRAAAALQRPVVHAVHGVRRLRQRRASGQCTRAREDRRRPLRRRQRSPRRRRADVQRGSGLLSGSRQAGTERPWILRAAAETRVHDAGAHLLHRLRARSAGGAAAPPAPHGVEPRLEMGCLLSAAPQREVRATAAGRAARDSRRARDNRDVVWRGRLRARHPPRLSRTRQGRQRLRHRPDREGSLPAVRPDTDDAQDAADVAVFGTPRAVLRRPGALAELGGWRKDRGDRRAFSHSCSAGLRACPQRRT